MSRLLILMALVFSGFHIQAVFAYDDCYYWGDVKNVTLNLPSSFTLDATTVPKGTVLWSSEFSTNIGITLYCRGTNYAGNYLGTTRQNTTDDGVFQTNNPGVALKIEMKPASNDFVPSDRFYTTYNYSDTAAWTWGSSTNTLFYTNGYFSNLEIRLTLVATGIAPTNAPLGVSGRLARYVIGPRMGGNSEIAFIADLYSSNDVQVNLRTPGCNVNTSSLLLALGERQLGEFTHVGYTTPYSDSRELTFDCVAGTKMTMTLAAQSDPDQPGSNAIRLNAPTDASTAKGVGVLLKTALKVDGVPYYSSDATPLNTALALTPDANRNWNVEQSTVVWNNGMSALDNKLSISAAYYQTLPVVTSGNANATAVINFSYN